MIVARLVVAAALCLWGALASGNVGGLATGGLGGTGLTGGYGVGGVGVGGLGVGGPGEATRAASAATSQGGESGSAGQQKAVREGATFNTAAGFAGRQAGRLGFSDQGFGKHQNARDQKGAFSAQGYDQQEGRNANNANSVVDSALQDGFNTNSQNRFNLQNQAQAAAYNDNAAKKNNFDRGNVLTDNVNYGFNKNFNNNIDEVGGYDEETSRNSHALDVFQDRNKLNKLAGSQAALQDARSDAQRALKENLYSQNAAQQAGQNAKYGQANRNQAFAGAQQQARDALLSNKNALYNSGAQGLDEALRRANQAALNDASGGRQSGVHSAATKGLADQRYIVVPGVGGVGGVGGVKGGVVGGAGGVGGVGAGVGGANVKGGTGAFKSATGEDSQALEAASQRAASKAANDAAAINRYNRGKGLVAADKTEGLRDASSGNLKQALQDANDQGYSGKNAQAANSAQGGNRINADAAAASKNNAARSDFAQVGLDSDVFRRRQSDRNDNQRRRKKFFHKKNVGGVNNERLVFNRQALNRGFGQDAAAQARAGHQASQNAGLAKASQDNRHITSNKFDRKAAQQNLVNSNQRAAGNAASQGATQSAQAADSAGQSRVNNQERLNDVNNQAQQQAAGLRENQYAQYAKAQRAAQQAAQQQNAHLGNKGGNLGVLGNAIGGPGFARNAVAGLGPYGAGGYYGGAVPYGAYGGGYQGGLVGGSPYGFYGNTNGFFGKGGVVYPGAAGGFQGVVGPGRFQGGGGPGGYQVGPGGVVYSSPFGGYGGGAH